MHRSDTGHYWGVFREPTDRVGEQWVRNEPWARQRGSVASALLQEATRPLSIFSSSLRGLGATRKDLRTLRMDTHPRNVPIPAMPLPPTVGTGSYQLSIPS